MHDGSRNTMHSTPATVREMLTASVWRSSPGTVIGSGIAGEVVGGLVSKGGLSEVCLQMTSFAVVPDSRTWFAEHLKAILKQHRKTEQNKNHGKKIQPSAITAAFIFRLLTLSSFYRSH